MIKIVRRDFAKIDLNVQFIELVINLELQTDLLVSIIELAINLKLQTDLLVSKVKMTMEVIQILTAIKSIQDLA